jgi:Sulfotransferase family
MPIFHNIKILHIHIPRTAGTNITYYLSKKEEIKLLKFPNKINLYSSGVNNNDIKGFNSSYQHLTYKEILTIYPDLSEYKIFAVVRNPYDRLVSEYHHQIDFTKKWTVKSNDIKEDFSNFVDWFLSQDDEFDNHRLPQYRFIEGCDNIKIIRYENLAEEFNNYFDDKLKFNILKSKREQYKDYYTNETKKKVLKYYKSDFEKFSFDIDL